MVKIVEYKEKITEEVVVVTHPGFDFGEDKLSQSHYRWRLTFEQAKMLQQALNEELGGIDDEPIGRDSQVHL